MEKEVRVILYPEEHKSKNGKFFEDLVRPIFNNEGYKLRQNINFTGLEIDLLGSHKTRTQETLIVECKAKEKVQSTEIKNFVYNVLIRPKADYGYFLHTIELDHQAAGLVEEHKNDNKLIFFGPDKIIDALIDSKKVKPIPTTNIDEGNNISKCILTYTYFGIYYILVTYRGTEKKKYHIFDACTLDEVTNLKTIADQNISITLKEDIFTTNIKELNEFDFVPLKKNYHEKKIESLQINSSFLSYLEETGHHFAHKAVDDIKLADIFVPVDLRNSRDQNKPIQVNFNLVETICEKNGNNIKQVFVGNKTSSKTSLCKFLYIKYFNSGYIPIIINGNDINNNIRKEAIVKLATQNYQNQYDSPLLLSEIENRDIILIIDDFDKSAKEKIKFRNTLIQNIQTEFKNIIITADVLMPLESATEFDLFEEFDIYTILEFGPKNRYTLVSNWFKLGHNERFSNQNELLRNIDEAVTQIKLITGKNYIPSHPFYILTILQAMESGNVQNPNYSIHGFYYELLINEALNKAVNDKKEISLFYNYLTFFSYHLFSIESKEISFKEFLNFHDEYCKVHDLVYDYNKILRVLENSGLLYCNTVIALSENYIYYFFVAKYLANTISSPSTRDIVSKMIQRVFREEYSSIIMFLTHLSKDEYIVTELLNNAKSIFNSYKPTKLENDINSINDLVKTLPTQVLELVDVMDKRQEEIEETDDHERIEKEFDNDVKYSNYGLDEDIDSIDFYAKLTLAVKTIDILGQVAKKYWGELSGDQKFSLIEDTYNLGLRALSFYLSLIQENTEGLIEHIKHLIEKKHIKDRFELKKNIDETVHSFIFRLCFLASWGVINRTANSIGYDRLENSQDKVLNHNLHNSYKLIDFAIKTGYSGIHFDKIVNYKKDMENNKLSFLILQNLVINHMYMFDTDFKQKNKICSLLKIKMDDQRYIDRQSKTKKSLKSPSK